MVPRGELAAHTASCPFEPVGCAQVGLGRIAALHCRSSTSYHLRCLYVCSDNATVPSAQAGHGCGWRGVRRGLAAHADSCWYERGRRHLEQAQAAVRSNERRAEELEQANLAAAELAKVRAEAAAAELAEVRAEAAAQLTALKAEVAAVKRESAAQVRKTQSWPRSWANLSLL